jgi:pimeloyl-ACP methyl ester carboxylesterase
LASRTILAVGDRDDYYVGFALRAARLAPTLTVEMIAGAGHVLPLEAPSACADIIERALKSST